MGNMEKTADLLKALSQNDFWGYFEAHSVHIQAMCGF
jgi:hypothetical protein